MRVPLLFAIVLASGMARAQTPPTSAAACERLGSPVVAEHHDHADADRERRRIHRARRIRRGEAAADRPLWRGRSGRFRTCPGRVTANTAGLGLGYNGGRGVPPFRALPAFCRVAATLEAVGLLRHSHGDVDADRRLERPLSRHQPQRTGRGHQLQRDGRRPDATASPSPAPTRAIRAATPPGCRCRTR